MLSPYRVLDLTDSHAQLGPMILADLGAEVIRIEPRGSDRHSGLYHVYNRGKKLTQCDIDTSEGKAQLLELVKSADFLFEDAGPGAMAARGLGYADLIQANPTLVYVGISPFGQDGPYANHANTDLTLAAMGGMAALNGEGDRPPVRVTVPQCWHHGAAESAAAALVAHHRRLQTGEPQFVDVSVQAAVTWTAIQAGANLANLFKGFAMKLLARLSIAAALTCVAAAASAASVLAQTPQGGYTTNVLGGSAWTSFIRAMSPRSRPSPETIAA